MIVRTEKRGTLADSAADIRHRTRMHGALRDWSVRVWNGARIGGTRRDWSAGWRRARERRTWRDHAAGIGHGARWSRREWWRRGGKAARLALDALDREAA